MSEHESATELLRRFESGDERAADELYCRYAPRLCELLRGQIGPKLRRQESAEDAVQSAFRTFFRRAAEGRFQVDHSRSLWRLLVKIALNKVRRHGRRAGREPHTGRDGGRLAEYAVGTDPLPEELVAVADLLDASLMGLPDRDRRTIQLRLQGYSTPEIAGTVGGSRWTVRRVLDRFGHQLQRKIETDS